MDAMDAEMVVYDEEEKKDKYLHFNEFDGCHFTVGDRSVFDYMVGDGEDPGKTEWEEEYDSINKAKNSKYYKCFLLLRKLAKNIDELYYEK